MSKKTKSKYEFTWTILDCRGETLVNGMKDFITDVEFTVGVVNKKDGTTEMLTSRVGFEIPDKKPRNYTPHSKVTTKKLLKWVQEKSDKKHMEDGALNRLIRANPPKQKNLTPK